MRGLRNASRAVLLSDLEGYGWCVRKGQYLNVGLGRRDGGSFPTHVREFVDWLERTGRAQRSPRGRAGAATRICWPEAWSTRSSPMVSCSSAMPPVWRIPRVAKGSGPLSSPDCSPHGRCSKRAAGSGATCSATRPGFGRANLAIASRASCREVSSARSGDGCSATPASPAVSCSIDGSSDCRSPLGQPGGTPPSGLSASFVQRLSGGASRLAALLLHQILPVFSVVVPCHPGAALRNSLHN